MSLFKIRCEYSKSFPTSVADRIRLLIDAINSEGHNAIELLWEERAHDESVTKLSPGEERSREGSHDDTEVDTQMEESEDVATEIEETATELSHSLTGKLL